MYWLNMLLSGYHKPGQESPKILTLAPGIAIPLVRVPAGEFIMGSSDVDPSASPYEKPQHRVYLEEYYMSATEVTVSQFRTFVQITGYSADSNALPSEKHDNPVTYVNRKDAVAFCRWASMVTDRDVRLPTEAQWEKAARGPDGSTYPWGNEQPSTDRCNYDNEGSPTPVWKYSPLGDSPYGCADMSGNVMEWVKMTGSQAITIQYLR